VFGILGKQRILKIYPISVLELDNVEPFKITETKGSTTFCTGLVRQGSSHCLCVAVKRTVYVYELNLTRVRHKRVKEIQCMGTIQCIEMMQESLCVGYQSAFALYSVQGDAAPMGECAIRCQQIHKS
jgi:serine/threonine-protein kinase MRCK